MTNRRRSSILVLLSLLLVTSTSCEKFSGDQEIPAYLTVDSIYLTTDYYTQGTASHKITDAWVYVDDELLGAFELPARLPVLKSGKHSVKVWPGIKKNGIATTRISYEFYKPVEKTLSLAPDSSTALGVLKSTYQTTAAFTWREDFEDVSVSLDTTTRSQAAIQKTSASSPLTFEGSHSGMVVLDTADNFFECQTHSEYIIPYAPVFLEMNFNTTNTLVVGVFVYGGALIYQTPIITLNPTGGDWKKIYIDLTNTLNAYPSVTLYRVYMSAWKDSGADQTVILFDNFKTVTRKSS